MELKLNNLLNYNLWLTHPNMVFHCVNDGLGKSMHQMKDLHEMMLEYGNIYKKRVHK
jgi:hypothetical protein